MHQKIVTDDFAEANRTKVATVLADLELALTFAATAGSSDNPETRARNREHARKAYFTIRDHLLSMCSPAAPERAQIDQKLLALRHQLERLGKKCA
jgi:hypothetical protein